jgi:hypothetical protein
MEDQRFLFVGEKRSKTAIKRGWTWDHARLAGRTLTEVLEACGLSRLGPPYGHYYEVVNAFFDDGEKDIRMLTRIEDYARNHGWIVIALGKKVSALLTHYAIPHRRITHPAARGAIRKRERYLVHVQQVLELPLETCSMSRIHSPGPQSLQGSHRTTTSSSHRVV